MMQHVPRKEAIVAIEHLHKEKSDGFQTFILVSLPEFIETLVTPLHDEIEASVLSNTIIELDHMLQTTHLLIGIQLALKCQPKERKLGRRTRQWNLLNSNIYELIEDGFVEGAVEDSAIAA